MSDGEGVSIRSLKTAKDIVSFLVDTDGAGVTETAEYIDKPVSTTYEYFDTLHELGYLLKGDDGYHVSTLHLSLGTKVRKQDPIFSAAKPQMDSFAEDHDTNITLLKEENGYGVTLYTVRYDGSIQAERRPGYRTYLHLNAGGKAILASLPRSRVREIVRRDGLAQITENTITKESELSDEIETVRERGFAIAREEGIVGINGVGVAIDVDGARSIGALFVFGPASSLQGERLTETIPEHLERLKNVIETNLTYQYFRGELE